MEGLIKSTRAIYERFCSSITEQLAYRLDVVSPEIVHDHNITWPEGRDQHLFQIIF